MEDLKGKYAMQFAMLTEIAPPEKYGGFPFSRRPHLRPDIRRHVEDFQSLDDARDFFHGIRYRVREYKKRLESRISRIEGRLNELNQIIKELEAMEEFDKDKIKVVVFKRQDSMMDDNEEDI